jgi:hypothetical protein
MAWLAQQVAGFTYPLDRQAAQARVLSTLTTAGIPTEQRQTAPELVARCLTLCMNLGLWRCWSERLEFAFQETGPTETSVTINAVPALLRSGVRAGERVTDLGALVSALRPS